MDVLFPCLRVRADGALSEKATGQAVTVYVCHGLKWTKMWCLGRIMKPPTHLKSQMSSGDLSVLESLAE